MSFHSSSSLLQRGGGRGGGMSMGGGRGGRGGGGMDDFEMMGGGRGGGGRGGGGRGGMGMSRQEQEMMMRQQEQEMMQRGARGGMGGGRGRGGAPQQQEMEEVEQEMPPQEPPKKPEGEPKFLKITTNDSHVTTIALNNAPVNSLKLEVFEELNDWLMWLSYTEETKAVILTSALNMVFSAGLDINELHEPKEDRFPEFWTQFQETWLILNTFPKPVVAAINGNSPAGGCVLSLCCDTRIMARSPQGKPEKAYRIGLNETKLGLVAPPWVMESFKYVVGSRKAERMLQYGETPTADEALAIGLVDQVVEENEVQAAAEAECKKALAIANEPRWMSKDMMRKEVVSVLQEPQQRDYDIQFFAQLVQNEAVQKNIKAYLDRLRGGKK